VKIVIIEDEPLTAEDLADILVQEGEGVAVTAILSSVKMAIDYFENNQAPDLIFADIQLGDGLSFEVFKAVEISTPVIFCTAYDEYALDAFDANGIDYVLKPFTAGTISKALAKYKQLQQNLSKAAIPYAGLYDLLESRLTQKRSSVLVYQRDKIIPLPLADIAVCYSQNLITHLLTFDQRNYTVNHTLEDLEAICGDQFFRANRQYLVNHKAIKDASQYFGRKLAVTLTTPFAGDIIVSKAKAPDFLTWLSHT
jgi:DNA-binding LytR/AlgR family response regulator